MAKPMFSACVAGQYSCVGRAGACIRLPYGLLADLWWGIREQARGGRICPGSASAMFWGAESVLPEWRVELSRVACLLRIGMKGIFFLV
jgi:hypothetical protein